MKLFRDDAGGGGSNLTRSKSQEDKSLRSHASKPLMAMIEVTGQCNMHCPVCFADAGEAGEEPDLATIEGYLKQLLQATGQPIPIQISGGEPTLRNDLPQILSLARDLGYWHIELVTNGIMIAEDPSLLLRYKEQGLTAVYLQFDGLQKETHLAIRGQDMRAVRKRSVGAIRQAGLCCTLAVAVARGVNEHEIPDVLDYAFNNLDVIRAVNFQTATQFAGRFELTPHETDFSLAELLRSIERQAGIPASSFRSDHLGHPSCNAMSLVFSVKGARKPLFSYLDDRDIRRFLGKHPEERFFALFRGKDSFLRTQLARLSVLRLILKAAPIFGRNPLNVFSSKHLLIFAKDFMEKDHLDPERTAHCCYALSGPSGVMSFCRYNNLYRGRDRHRS